MSEENKINPSTGNLDKIGMSTSDVSDLDLRYLKLDQTAPQTFVGLNTGLLKVTAGLLGLDTSVYLTTESDPVFGAWYNSGSPSLTDLYITNLTSGRCPYISTGGLLIDNSLYTFTQALSATEIITNGTFTGSASGWSLGAGYTYSSNTVLHSSNGTAPLSQSLAGKLEPGFRYQLTYTLSAMTAGSVIPTVGGTVLTSRTTAGTYTEDFNLPTAISSWLINFSPSTLARFTIDNISLKKYPPTMLLNGGAYTGGGCYLAQGRFGQVQTLLGNPSALQAYMVSTFPNSLTDPLALTIGGTQQSVMGFIATGYSSTQYIGYAKGDSAGYMAFGGRNALIFEAGGFGSGYEAMRITETGIYLWDRVIPFADPGVPYQVWAKDTGSGTEFQLMISDPCPCECECECECEACTCECEGCPCECECECECEGCPCECEGCPCECECECECEVCPCECDGVCTCECECEAN
jgi:hypothetical protein